MSPDPPRLRDDASAPEGLRDLMSAGAAPPPMDAAARAASAAGIAELAAAAKISAAASTTAVSTTAAASTTTVAASGAGILGGTKLWLVVGGFVAAAGVTALAVTGLSGASTEPRNLRPSIAEETPAADEPSDPGPERVVEAVAADVPPDVTPDVPAPEEVAGVPEPTQIAPAAPVARPRGRSSRERVAEPASDSLLVEASTLEQARRLLATDPAGALAQTNQHAREHPRGQLAAEREIIAIDALRRLRRPDQARRRARRLIARAPSGIYVERARAILRELGEPSSSP